MKLEDSALFAYRSPLVGGEFLASTSLGSAHHLDPSTGKPQAEYQQAGAAEIDAAVASAHKGLKAWREAGAEYRRDVLWRWAQLVEPDAELFAMLAAREHGAPLITSLPDLALKWMRYFLALMKFKTEEEAVTKANDTRYGPGAYLHTNDLKRAHRVAAALKSGTFGINWGFPMSPVLPFGGYGESGYGREGGRAGLEEFLQHKSVYIPLEKGFGVP